MDRNWMTSSRLSDAYDEGIRDFCKVAKQFAEGIGSEYVFCPCADCWNNKMIKVQELHKHLFLNGIDPQYKIWHLHGESESGIPPSQDEEELSDDNMDWEDDDLIGLVHNIENEMNVGPAVIETLRTDSEIPLYDGCSNFTKLSAVLKLFNLKAKNGWSDKSFTELLSLIGSMLPYGNKLPTRTYDAKKVLCPMGIEYEKIHACPNDCILFRGKHEQLSECPVCKTSRYKLNKAPDKSSKGAPAKIIWYLPPIPRFQRLFSISDDSNNLRWHSEQRVDDYMLRHPADSLQWKTFDEQFPEFGSDPRNLRLGLCTDGVNPFGNLSSKHSTWPVILVIYNLPPWLTMKRRYMLLSLVISGPRQPGNDIDVYLQPLIEDLKRLWNDGVPTYDALKDEFFNMRAMLFCTINDFPAYGNLSGYKIKGYKACPICGESTDSQHLPNCRKIVYMGHRRFLPHDHVFRRKKAIFNGKVEFRNEPRPVSGRETLETTWDYPNVFGKQERTSAVGLWKKRSIFFDLPYWHMLSVRHCIDVMHVEKNICDSLIGTLLNIPGKTKDGVKARLDMLDMNIRKELAPEQRGKKIYIPPACTTLSKTEKISFCACLKGVKVPSGFSSNISSLVSVKDLRLNGLKSHDCHTLMQQLLPIAIRGILPDKVRMSIQRLCTIFSSLCAKTVDPLELDVLQNQIAITLCQLEMYFPPSFFDIMVHLTVHLVREIKFLGPVHMRWMYPFERYMKILKSYVRNRHRPEGSMVEGYIAEEAIEFCSQYLGNTESVGIPKPRHYDRLRGKGTIGKKSIVPPQSELHMAHFYVLRQIDEIIPYVDRHLTLIRSYNHGKSEQWIQKKHSREFSAWLKDDVLKLNEEAEDGDVTDFVKSLGVGPNCVVHSFKGYDFNGYSFYTRGQDERSSVQNSGVTIVADTIHVSSAKDLNPIHANVNYFGVIEDIWEIDYIDFRIPVFKCKWVHSSNVRVDEFGMTFVDFRREGYKDEPFIMAEQAKQVFYVSDPTNDNNFIVVDGKQHIYFVEGTTDDYCEHIASVGSTLPIEIGDSSEVQQRRVDHDEGIWID